MGLKRMLTSKWYIRLVLVCWVVCAISIFVLFKNMELIVHGQLYYYGLIFDPAWADPFRLLTWLLYLCISLPSFLTCIALGTTFLKVEKVPEKNIIFHKAAKPIPAMAKVRPQQPVAREVSGPNKNGKILGILCPKCKKSFGRALVMLDFHEGKNQLVSVCPYCNYVLGKASKEENKPADVNVAVSK
jgi:hypothetical protein